jgi:acyl carrier protein
VSEHKNVESSAGIDPIAKEIRSLIAEIVELPEESITESSSFQDLGADSLMALEIVASIEKKYRIHIPEEELQRVKSFGDTIALVREYLARASG